MRVLLLVLLLLAGGCEKSKLTVQWTVLGQNAADGCAQLAEPGVFAEPLPVHIIVTSATGQNVEHQAPCEQGQTRLEVDEGNGMVRAYMRLWCGGTGACQSGCPCPTGFCDTFDDYCKDLGVTSDYDLSMSSAPIVFALFDVDLPTPDAGVADASVDAGGADATTDAVPPDATGDAGPAGPDQAICYCTDATSAALCGELPTCEAGQPAPGTICTDFCASHGGLSLSQCTLDAVACM